jgi:hypothetical protein
MRRNLYVFTPEERRRGSAKGAVTRRDRNRRLMPERFWARVNKRGPIVRRLGRCWNWTGLRQPRAKWAYGRLTVNSRSTFAHRVSWELAMGWIPTGFWVLHHCDNPVCVRPSHLYLGTAVENARDRQTRGRTARGERAGSSKLTEAQVRAIRASSDTSSQIVKRYGITSRMVWLIRKRLAWAHVR